MSGSQLHCPHCGTLATTAGAQCLRCGGRLAAAEDEVFTTRLESAAEVRQAVKAGMTAGKAAGGDPEEPPRWRPTGRPPLALVCVVDDGTDQGEWVRLRGSEWTVGRTDGDLLIPHDTAISGRHFRIFRAVRGGVLRWRLEDLNSSNGTFVRCAESLVPHAGQLIVGQTRLRLELAEAGNGATAAASGGTRMLNRPGAGPLASLVRVGADGGEERLALTAPRTWIGREPGPGGVTLGDDPYANPRHAELVRQDDGSWKVTDRKSRNGTWIAVGEISLGKSAEILAGEQRFLFRVV